jgi:hypothetical protein
VLGVGGREMETKGVLGKFSATLKNLLNQLEEFVKSALLNAESGATSITPSNCSFASELLLDCGKETGFLLPVLFFLHRIFLSTSTSSASAIHARFPPKLPSPHL